MAIPDNINKMHALRTDNIDRFNEVASDANIKNAEDTNVSAVESDNHKEDEDESIYPSGIPLLLILVSLNLTTFLFALDGTILATALPVITSKLGGINDVSWYSAAFFITTCAFQLPFGRAYTLLNTKWTYLTSILIFLLGSAVCGAAPNSISFIIGRAIAGAGGAGVMGGAFIIIAKSFPLRKRSLYTGIIAASLSICSVVGPIIGGAFTQHVSWRWCFYINLPIGGAVVIFVALCLPNTLGCGSSELKTLTWFQILRRFNPVATVILLASVTSLLIALQWGAEGGWSSKRVIATLTVFAVTFLAWSGLQYVQGDEATVPWSVIKQRTVAGATIYTFLGIASFTIVVFYLPIWFQMIKGDSSQTSGIHILPITIGTIVFAIAAGGGTMLIGYYSVFLYLGTVCLSLGAGLMMTLRLNSSAGSWIGYQILAAAGAGMSIEQCNIAVQAVLPAEKIPAGTSLVIFARSLASAIGLAIGQNVFQKALVQELKSIVPASVVIITGLTDLISTIEEIVGHDSDTVTDIYSRVNEALIQAFLAALIMAALTLPCATIIEWKSVKTENRKKEDAKEKRGMKEKKSDNV